MIDAPGSTAYLRGMTEWIGIVEDRDGVRGWGFRDGLAVSEAAGQNSEDILAQLGEADVFIVAPSTETQKTPAKLLPDRPPFGDLTQDTPRARLTAPQRLRLVGFQANQPDWDGVVVLLDADHSHWCLISAGELVGFQSFLTPRLIAALNLPQIAAYPALSETLSRPERLAAHLAQSEHDPKAMTGHLIGAELGAARAWWLGQQVVVVGAPALASSYTAGLTPQGVPVATCKDTLAAGLAALRAHLG